MEFKLAGDFIELDNLLKRMDLVATGGEAKKTIQEGLVQVNGAVESRVRRKLRVHDCVVFEKYVITIV